MLLTDILSNCTNINYVACKTRHLITNLVVLEINLTCLTEMKQQHYKDMKLYVACKMMHLITNLVVHELNLTCLREMKQQLNDKVKQSTIHLTTCCLTHPSSW
jgi:GTPase SAR1 family protein